MPALREQGDDRAMNQTKDSPSQRRDCMNILLGYELASRTSLRHRIRQLQAAGHLHPGTGPVPHPGDLTEQGRDLAWMALAEAEVSDDVLPPAVRRAAKKVLVQRRVKRLRDSAAQERRS